MQKRRGPNLLGVLWQEVRKEAGGALTWRMKMEKLEAVGLWSGTEGGSVDPKGEMATGDLSGKQQERKEKS